MKLLPISTMEKEHKVNKKINLKDPKTVDVKIGYLEQVFPVYYYYNINISV